jgi:hypothetical protein
MSRVTARRQSHRHLAAIVPLLAIILAGCGADPRPPVPSIPEDARAHFRFVRDDAGILPAGQRRQAEERLSEIAEATGVYGVVVTAGENAAVDPPRIFTPIIEEVGRLHGEAIVMICTPASCGRDASTARTEGLEVAAERLGDVAGPNTGRPNLIRALWAWIEYVAALAAAAP